MKDDSDAGKGAGAGFGAFAAKQMLPIVGVAVVIIAALWIAIPYFGEPGQRQDAPHQSAATEGVEAQAASPADTSHATADTPAAKDDHAAAPPAHQPSATASAEDVYHEAVETETHAAEKLHEAEPPPRDARTVANGNGQASASDAGAAHTKPAKKAANGHATKNPRVYPMVGMAFVDALIKPMDYELNQRFYGWRPNDLVEYTDNVNSYQLGVLEVTRRTTRILAERIARTGSTARFDPNLENAMNWFMIKADRYWFPSAESKYQDGLKELRAYYHKLERDEAEFYTRADNLIPLLAAFRDLLGSCDENLVKTHETDGSEVSFYKTDDYLYYAKGVASALYTILSAVEHDFHNVMATREGSLEVLHHAIESCHHATEVDPWFILDSDYGSIWANHRANMAAPISHAYFYVGILIKALST